MIRYLLVIMALIFAFYGTANAEFYTWEDEDGVVHITDYPPKQSKTAKPLQVQTHESGRSQAQEKDTATEEKNKAEVIIFTKNECPDCEKAKAFLKAKNISYTEYNMDTNKEAAEKRKKYDDGADVPYAIINRNQVFGFSEAVYERVLKMKP